MFRQINAAPDDCEGLVNIGRSVRGTEVSILAKEVEDQVFRVSFRSDGEVDVAVVAQRFKGGGHKAASGCTMKVNAEVVERQLVFEMQQFFGAEG